MIEGDSNQMDLNMTPAPSTAARDQVMSSMAQILAETVYGSAEAGRDIDFLREQYTNSAARAAEFAARLLLGEEGVEIAFWKAKAYMDAWGVELHMGLIRDALNSPMYAYTTSSHIVSARQHVYHRDPKSPTGVRHVISLTEENARGMAFFKKAGKIANTIGGQAGQSTCHS